MFPSKNMKISDEGFNCLNKTPSKNEGALKFKTLLHLFTKLILSWIYTLYTVNLLSLDYKVRFIFQVSHSLTSQQSKYHHPASEIGNMYNFQF